MKRILLATTLIVAGGAAAAADLGYGLTFDSSLTGEYNIDQSAFTVVSNPTLSYNAMDWATLSVSTEATIFDGDSVVLGEAWPTLEFRAEKELDMITVYGGVSYDLDTKTRGDMVVGATFSF